MAQVGADVGHAVGAALRAAVPLAPVALEHGLRLPLVAAQHILHVAYNREAAVVFLHFHAVHQLPASLWKLSLKLPHHARTSQGMRTPADFPLWALGALCRVQERQG